MTEPSVFEVEMAVEKLKRHKTLGIDQIPAELFNAGGRTIFSEIHKPVHSVWNKEELPEDWKESIIVPICKKGDATDCSNYRGTLLSTSTKFYPPSSCQSLLHMQRKLLGIIIVDFKATGQLLTIYSAFVKFLKKLGMQLSSASALNKTSRKLMIWLEGRSFIIFSLSLVLS